MSKYLRTAWAITQGELAPEGGGVIPDPNQRGLFQIDTSFTRERIPADTRAIYDAAMAVLARYDSDLYKNVLSGSPDSPGGNKIDIYSARNLRNNLHANALMLDATGDPLMLTRIIDAWTVVWGKAETSWSPGYLATRSPLEFKGIKRLNLYRTSDRDLQSGLYTNYTDLENDLHSGYCGMLRYILWRNRDLSPAAATAYNQVSEYHDDLTVQRRAFSKDRYGSKPDYWWGKALHHSTTSRHAEAFFMVLMGNTSWEPELSQFEAWLGADIEYYNHPDGYRLYGVPHGVQGRYAAQGTSLPQNEGFQDCTYIGEEWPCTEIMCRAGSGFWTPPVVEAIAHTCDQGVFYDGYGAKPRIRWNTNTRLFEEAYTVGGTIGGGGTTNKTTRKFFGRDGRSFASTWKARGPSTEFPGGARELIHQVQRNPTTVPLWRIMTPEIDAGLAEVSRVTNDQARKFADLTRFLGKIKGRLP